MVQESLKIKQPKSAIEVNIPEMPPLPEFFIQPVKCPTADDFLTDISPTGKHLGEHYLPRQYIFRGQANADWPLIPSALRQSKKGGPFMRLETIPGPESWGRLATENEVDQVRAEVRTLRAFHELADQAGLPIPEDSQFLREVLEAWSNPTEQNARDWPFEPLLSLLAIAQHHRVPTRLLDWTYNPLVAAFFAAQGGIRALTKKIDLPECIGVWAMWLAPQLMQSANHSQPYPLRIVHAPSAGNPNLRAQDGCFTVIKFGDDRELTVDRRPVDRIIRDYSTNLDFGIHLYHFMLPLRESRNLLRLLAFHGITASRIYPGFSGAALALKHERAWRSLRGIEADRARRPRRRGR